MKRKKKKRKEERTTEEQWRKKKSGEERKKKWSKGAADLTSGSLHVCLITKMPLKTELWKLKTHFFVFSVSITHHSKIRELSDGNKNWKQSY